MPLRFLKGYMPATVTRKQSILAAIIVSAITLGALTLGTASAQVMAKAQVANLIAKVENGVDEFRDYLKRRGDNARETAATPAAQTRR